MIYFIQNSRTEAVKIGYTAGTPADRRRTFQTGNQDRLILLGAVPGDIASERAFHDLFGAERIDASLEWFHGTPRLLAIVRGMVAGFVVPETSPEAEDDEPGFYWGIDPETCYPVLLDGMTGGPARGWSPELLDQLEAHEGWQIRAQDKIENMDPLEASR